MSESPRLALGTVQFGLPYGFGRPDRPVETAVVTEILATAWKSGIDMLDTAAEYGDAERLIGEVRPAESHFAIVTKVPRLSRERLVRSDIEIVRAAVRTSIARLRVNTLDALLVHHAPNLLAPGGAELFEALRKFREEGIVRRIGVSVYDPETLDRILETFPIEVVQLPVNLFDQRFAREGGLERLKSRGIEIHARSVFLRGLLLLESERVPAQFASLRQRLARLNSECAAFGISRSAAALRFAARSTGVRRIVIGVDSIEQLTGNLESFAQATAGSEMFDAASYAVDDPDMIDPRRWSS